MSTNDTTETTGQRRLREAREQLAELEQRRVELAGTPVTTEPDGPRTIAPGEVFHALADGLTIGRSAEPWSTLPAIVTKRGATYTADADMIAAAVNRHGQPGWTATVHDEAAQLRRWGRVYLAPGPAPEGLASWEHGSPEWAQARAAAHAAAVAEPDAEQRAAKLAEVQRIYGNPPETGQAIRYNHNREHDAQRDRLEGRATPRKRVQ